MHFGVNCVRWKEGNIQLKEEEQALQRFMSPVKLRSLGEESVLLLAACENVFFSITEITSCRDSPPTWQEILLLWPMGKESVISWNWEAGGERSKIARDNN